MRRPVVALGLTAAGLVALLSYRTPAQPPAAGASAGTPATLAGATVRTLTGKAVSTRWGPVQVAVTLTDGSITQVTILQQPDGNGRDREIGAYALPRLQAQTLSAQSAQVDVVSGATYTSEGYISSLQSALDQR